MKILPIFLQAITHLKLFATSFLLGAASWAIPFWFSGRFEPFDSGLSLLFGQLILCVYMVSVGIKGRYQSVFIAALGQYTGMTVYAYLFGSSDARSYFVIGLIVNSALILFPLAIGLGSIFVIKLSGESGYKIFTPSRASARNGTCALSNDLCIEYVSKNICLLLDETAARTMTQKVILRSWLSEILGPVVLSSSIYCLVLYSLLFNHDITLALGWRVLIALLFSLVPAMFVRNALINGSFLLGLSQRGLTYRCTEAVGKYVLCPWCNLESVSHQYDGETDYVVLRLKCLPSEQETLNGHTEIKADVNNVFLAVASSSRAMKIIGEIEQFSGNVQT